MCEETRQLYFILLQIARLVRSSCPDVVQAAAHLPGRGNAMQTLRQCSCLNAHDSTTSHICGQGGLVHLACVLIQTESPLTHGVEHALAEVDRCSLLRVVYDGLR